MRRNQVEQLAQAEKNYIANPKMVSVSPGTDIVMTNYAANPSLEGATHHTGGIGGTPATFSTVAIASDKAHSGTQSFKLGNCTAAGQAGRKAMTNPYTALKVMKGQKVSWSFWIYSTVAGTIAPYWEGKKVSDNSYTGGGSSTGTITVPANTWTYVYGTNTLTFDSYVEGAGGYNLAVGVGDSVWFDDFCITQSDAPEPYFDGNTPAADGYAYSWSGTANASASLKKAMASIVRTNLVANPSFRATNGLAAVRTNLLTNPSFERAVGTTDVWTNNVMNPTFKSVSGTTETRKNLVTNPSFETASGTVDVWTNLSTNPSFEAAGALLNVRTNLVPNPSFEGTTGVVTARTNYVLNPRGVTSFVDYSGVGNQTITPNVAITGNPDGITTANRVSYASGAANPGVTLLMPVVSGTIYTISAWVYHETIPTGGNQGFAQAGVASQTPPPALVQGTWQRMSWMHTASGTSQLGFRVSSPASAGSFLITGVLVETANAVLPFFDGASTSAGDYTYAWTGTVNASTSQQRVSAVTGVPSSTKTIVHQSSDWSNRAGTKSLRITVSDWATTDTFASLEGDTGAIRLGMVAGKTYTISGTCRLAAPQTGTPSLRARKIVLFYNQNNGAYQEVSSNQAANVAGIERVKLTFTLPTDTTEAFVRLYNGTVAGSGDIWWDDVIVEEGTTSGDYFDGSNPIQNLMTNPSFESTLGTWTTVSGGTVSRDTSTGYVGTSSAKINVVNSIDGAYFSGSAATVTGGTVITTSAWVKAPVGQSFRFDTDTSPDGTSWQVSNTTNHTATGNWQRVNHTTTMPAGTTKVTVGFKSNATWTGSIWVDAILIEIGTVLTPYYEGTGDYTYAWLGAANNSVSSQQAPVPLNVTGGNVKAHQSSVWSKGGGKSVKLIPMDVSGSNATSVQVPVTLVAGKTYTVLATRYLDKPITGTLNSSYGGRIALVQPGLTTLASDTILPNTAGEGTIRWTFTVDVAATGHTLRLGHGGVVNSGEVWWDRVLVVEGKYTGNYFDGTIPATENLVKTTALASNGLTHTTGVSYAGQTWTRASVPANNVGGMSRQMVALADLYQGERYTVSVTVANDQSTAQTVQLDWADTGHTPFTIQPGETRRISIYSTRTNYDIVYRFSDLDVTSSATETRSILYKDWVIEMGQTVGDYPYTGTGDFTYVWTGTANASTSIQRATGVSGITAPAYLCRAFQSSYNPTNGSKTLRVTGTSTSTDVFAEFNSLISGYTFKANTTYTLAADRILPAPLVGASGQLVRANIGNAEMSITTKVAAPNVAGRSRFVVSFTTGAETTLAFIRIYSGSPAGGGDVWFDRLTFEEGVTDGSYFDGSTPVQKNLCTNPTMDTTSGTTTIRTNLSNNPSFEVAMTNWSALSLVAGHGRTSTRAHSGSYSAFGVATDKLGDSMFVPTTNYTVAASTTYTVSAYAWVPAGVVATDFRDNDRNLWALASDYSVVTKSYLDFSKTNQWQRISTTISIPAGVTGLSVRLYCPANALGIYWDSVLVEKGPSLLPYFDGSTAATGVLTYGWDGTAGASTSREMAPLATGWAAGPNFSAAVSMVQAFNGTKSLALTRTTTAAGSGYVSSVVGDAKAGQSYTASAYVYGGTGNYQLFLNDANNAQAIATAKTVFAAPGNTWTRVSFTFTSTINFTNLSIFITDDNNPVPTLGSVLYVDSVMVEESATLRPFYISTGDHTYAWVGTANASASTQTAPSPVGSNANYNVTVPNARFFRYQATDEFGKKYNRWYTPAGTDSPGWRVAAVTNASLNTSSIVAGQSYTLVMRQRSSGWTGTQNAAIGFMDATGANVVIGFENTPLNTNGWQVYRRTFTAAISGLSTTNLYVSLPANTNGATDAYFDIAEWALVTGAYTGPFFDGSSVSASTDLFYAWTGTADASTSVLRGNAVTDIANANGGENIAKHITSTEWSASTGKSLRIIPVGTQPDTSAQIAGSPTSLGVLVPGKTYTVKATFRQAAPQTGGLQPRARGIMYADSVVGWAAAPVVAATNTAGSQTLTHTFTVNAAATWATVRLYNGASGGNGDVWWDDVVLVEGGYTDGYFDGSTAASTDFSYSWSGTANASTSLQSAMQIDHHAVEPKLISYRTPTGSFKALVKDPNGGGGRAFVPRTSPGVNMNMTAGKAYTIKLRAKKLSTNTTLRLAGGISVMVPLTTSMADYTFTVTPSSTNVLYVELGSGVNDAGIEIENLMVVEGGYTGAFFDGGTSASDSLVRRWTGTPDASTSQEIGTLTSRFSDEPNIKHYKISDGAMRVINVTGTTHSLQTESDMVISGKKCTVLFRARSFNGGQLKVYGLENSPSVSLTSSYEWYRVIAIATDNRLYFSTQGGISGAGFDISHMLIARGRYDGNYFDGNYPHAKWIAGTNNSASVGYSY